MLLRGRSLGTPGRRGLPQARPSPRRALAQAGTARAELRGWREGGPRPAGGRTRPHSPVPAAASRLPAPGVPKEVRGPNSPPVPAARPAQRSGTRGGACTPSLAPPPPPSRIGCPLSESTQSKESAGRRPSHQPMSSKFSRRGGPGLLREVVRVSRRRSISAPSLLSTSCACFYVEEVGASEVLWAGGGPAFILRTATSVWAAPSSRTFSGRGNVSSRAAAGYSSHQLR